MMTTIYQLLLFVIVCICYIHIWNHIKKSDNLEIYKDIYIKDENGLSEMSSLKIPYVFNHDHIETIKQFNLFKMISSSIIQYRIIGEKQNHLHFDDISSFKNRIKDSSNCVLSEYNWKLSETNDYIHSYFNHIDDFLRPSMCAFHKRDIIFGSGGSSTPLRYEIYSHIYLHAVQVKKTIKIILFPYSKITNIQKQRDLLLLEFRTSIDDIWRETEKYQEGRDYIVVELKQGDMFSIPNYMYYSIQLQSNEDVLFVTRYMSYVGILANSPLYSLHQIQKWNVKPNPTYVI